MTGAEIRATRLRFGLSQAALARALGLPDPERGGQVTACAGRAASRSRSPTCASRWSGWTGSGPAERLAG